MPYTTIQMVCETEIRVYPDDNSTILDRGKGYVGLSQSKLEQFQRDMIELTGEPDPLILKWLLANYKFVDLS